MRKWVRGLMVGAIALAPVAGFAAIDNTHHDMNFLISSKEKCAYCHSKTTSGADTTYGAVGSFCVQVCHISTSAVAGAGNRPQVTPDSVGQFGYNTTTHALTFQAGTGGPGVLNSGHGFDPAAITTWGGVEADVTGTNWPHVNEALMQCTSCHAVHDNTNPPFLNARYDGFCERCHSGKVGNYANTTTGNHPTAMAFRPATALAFSGTNVAANQKTGEATTIMNGRQLRAPASATAPAPANVYLGFTAFTTSANNTATNWELSSHLLDTTDNLPHRAVTDGATDTANSRFGCYSCHNAHQNNAVNGGMDGSVAASNMLLVGGDTDNNLATATATQANVCYGCHGDTANANDPGKSGNGHPINEEVTTSTTNTWTVPLSGDYAAIHANYRKAGAPMCVTCHDVHGGEPGLMAVRIINATQPESACDYCHQGSFTNAAANSHHPGVVGTNYTSATWGFANAAWMTIDGNGDLDDGLTCQDCHIGDGTSTKRSTAHNWR